MPRVVMIHATAQMHRPSATERGYLLVYDQQTNDSTGEGCQYRVAANGSAGAAAVGPPRGILPPSTLPRG